MSIWVAPINDAPTFTPGARTVTVLRGQRRVQRPMGDERQPGPPSESWQIVHFEIGRDLNGVPNLFAVRPSIDADGNLTFTPAPDQSDCLVTVRAKDDGGLEDWGVTARPIRTTRATTSRSNSSSCPTR